MASIERIETPAGTRWRARWRSPDQHQHSKRFRRRIDAERWLTEVEHSKLTGTYVDPKEGRITLREYAEQWRQNQVHHRLKTRDLIEGRLRNHLYPTLGDRPIGTLLRSDVQAWVAGLSERLAPRTVEVTYGYLATILRSAMMDRIIAVSPCRSVNLPERAPPRPTPMTAEEVRRISEAMPALYGQWVIIVATTGLRMAESCGLTIDRINFVRGTLRVDRQWLGTDFGPPKTPTSVREIPLSTTTVAALTLQVRERPPLEPEGFVFHTGTHALTGRRVSEAWRAAVERAGVGRNLVPHDLRHFYASLLIHAGCSVKEVQERMGHKSAQTTLDVYGHLWPNAEDRSRAAIDAAFELQSATEHSGQ